MHPPPGSEFISNNPARKQNHSLLKSHSCLRSPGPGERRRPFLTPRPAVSTFGGKSLTFNYFQFCDIHSMPKFHHRPPVSWTQQEAVLGPPCSLDLRQITKSSHLSRGTISLDSTLGTFNRLNNLSITVGFILFDCLYAPLITLETSCGHLSIIRPF